MLELDFNTDKDPEDILDMLTANSILCQIDYGMSWDSVKTLFGDKAHDAAKVLYNEEMKRSRGEL